MVDACLLEWPEMAGATGRSEYQQEIGNNRVFTMVEEGVAYHGLTTPQHLR